MRIRMTTHVESDVAATIHRLATSRGISVSSVMSDLLERGVVTEASDWGETMIVPLLEEVIRKEVSAGFNRLARLLVRTALEAGTGRGIATHLLMQLPNMERGAVRRLGDSYWADAVRRLKTPIEDIPELVAALQGLPVKTSGGNHEES